MLLVKPFILRCKNASKKKPAKAGDASGPINEEGEEGESTVPYQKLEEPIASEEDFEEEF